MRFATVSGRSVIVEGGRAVDVEEASTGRFPADPMALFDRWDELLAWHRDTRLPGGYLIDSNDLDAPSPRPRQVFAVASNYWGRASVVEGTAELPVVFTKFPSSIVGPTAPLVLPTETVDWEVELVVVMGKAARGIPVSEAWGAVAGLTVGQDFSERTLQLGASTKQFSLGKSFAGFGPTGPVLVSPDEFLDRDDIGLACRVNGEVVQSGRTSQMILSVPELISRISGICELGAGDLIFTGTPAGMGMGMVPPRYLKPGDVVRSDIDGIGELRNVCVTAHD